MSAIEFRGVTKRYGSVRALDALDLTVERGEVFGFLGPNGAGKSTAINILLKHVLPTAGEVSVLDRPVGEHPAKLRERLGVLPETFAAIGELTGREQIEFAIETKSGDEDPETIIDRVGLGHRADRRASTYSKGDSQRLMLATALAGEPDLLVLDEPTTGLDPNGARQLRQIIAEENERGATVFFSSHILEQVEAVCDRVGILNQGELVAIDTVERLRKKAGLSGQITVELESVTDGLVETVSNLDGVSSVTLDGTTLTAGCRNVTKASVVQACLDAGSPVANIETSGPSLEDLFAAYTEDE